MAWESDGEKWPYGMVVSRNGLHRYSCTHILVPSSAALPTLISSYSGRHNTELVLQTGEMEDSSGQSFKSEKCNFITWGQHIMKSPLEVEGTGVSPSTGGSLSRVWHLPCLHCESVDVLKLHVKHLGRETSFEFSLFGNFLIVHHPCFSHHLCLALTPSKDALLAEIFLCSQY